MIVVHSTENNIIDLIDNTAIESYRYVQRKKTHNLS